ncbi:transporter associated domain-containing protein [Amphibiibacter pelophylacis]|uniref:Transporter associated domain-containing protein n=1 Tax=Amphibiibacter pelophylacis TaxID=1799477 RepID=A0ACC6P555_9BURK
MSEHPAGGSSAPAAGAPDAAQSGKKGFFERLMGRWSGEPDAIADRAALLAALGAAADQAIIDRESHAMLSGVLRLAERSAADVMVTRKRMDLVDIAMSYDAILSLVLETRHSRFPVYEDDTDRIIGVLLAKDLLMLQRAPELNLRTLLRPAMFVPESKNLAELLREFRAERNHIAIVVDEFGSTAGLVTIEDVLEEIVGEIEDEYDEEDEEDRESIVSMADGSWRVSGDTDIEAVNKAFGSAIDDSDFDTIAGCLTHAHGQLPVKGQILAVDREGRLLDTASSGSPAPYLTFQVMLARGGTVRWFRVRTAVPVAPDRPASAV